VVLKHRKLHGVSISFKTYKTRISEYLRKIQKVRSDDEKKTIDKEDNNNRIRYRSRKLS
jgi:hypothetical protein